VIKLDNLEGLTNQELLREFNNLRVPIMNAFDILFHCPKQGEGKVLCAECNEKCGNYEEFTVALEYEKLVKSELKKRNLKYPIFWT